MNYVFKLLTISSFALLCLSGSAQAQTGATALYFNSINPADKVSVPMNSPTGAFTLEAWVKFDDTFWPSFSTVMEFGDDEPWFGIANSPTGGQISVYRVVIGNVPVPVRRWAHVAYTWDGTVSRVFVDGVQAGMSTNAPDLSGTGLSIGAEENNASGWEGKIDEVMVWNTARTPAQLLADRNGYRSAQPGMLAYFPFNEGTGQLVTNLVPNAPSGVLGISNVADTSDPIWVNDVNSTRPPKNASFAFEGNVPNPFGDQTTNLSFRLSKPGPVHLAVYDATGRQVATLVDEFRPIGRYTVPFTGAGLCSGVYVCRLTTDGQTLTHPMLLTR